MRETPRILWSGFPNRLVVGLLVGSLLGSALTAVASASLRSTPVPAATAAAPEFPKRPLDREWRGYKTPVDADSMFRKRG